MGSTAFRDPQALSSALAALGSPQLRPSGPLKAVEPLVLLSMIYNYVDYRKCGRLALADHSRSWAVSSIENSLFTVQYIALIANTVH